MSACLLPGVETRVWAESGYADFEKGTIRGLSLRSDGQLMLAPRFEERFDYSSAYLWALAADSKGNIYAGGGPGARLYRIPPKGDVKVLAELEGLEIHAIAVDARDNVYAATSPDGKVYRLGSAGKPEVFYDPRTKYIWAMAFNSQGELFVATGDRGEVHRVGRDGKGKAFFQSDESHARSLAIDAQDNVIIGTEPRGLVVRISPSGEGFVLHQMSRKEITAVAVGGDGSVYAAGVGNKQPAPVLPSAPVLAPAPAPPGPAAPLSMTPQQRPPAPPPAFTPGAQQSVAGGSELWRISPDGNPRRLWTHPQDIVYALGFDAAGRVLLGSGNRGYIYRVDSDSLHTALLNAPPTQITGFCAGRDGKLYAATGNAGKVYQIGPEPAEQGWIESDVFDAGVFSHWGRLSFKGDSGVSIVTRSGNLDQPHRNWSAWSAPVTGPRGARLSSPPARFLQWKATLSRGPKAASPVLDRVEVAYLPRNLQPRIDQIEITPANYRFPPPPAPLAASPNLNLPPIGRPRSVPLSAMLESTPAMQPAEGWIGARWSASDDNGDAILYTVHIRGAAETEWKPLKDKIREKYLSWDSTAFPDGEYRLRVTASDAPDNPPEMALSTSLASDSFLIDNSPPAITGLVAVPGASRLTVRWKAMDALSVIQDAQYSLDGGEWIAVLPVSRLSDSLELDYELHLDGLSAGEHTIAVRVQDEFENQATGKVVVRP
ncbi:MAG: hypothetical protein FJW37_07190 [Acidobacteria bacterium]|nr:hypothetical protein [Acidobacteriota bacterium]